jgi:hypothetical protein
MNIKLFVISNLRFISLKIAYLCSFLVIRCMIFHLFSCYFFHICFSLLYSNLEFDFRNFILPNLTICYFKLNYTAFIFPHQVLRFPVFRALFHLECFRSFLFFFAFLLIRIACYLYSFSIYLIVGPFIFQIITLFHTFGLANNYFRALFRSFLL